MPSHTSEDLNINLTIGDQSKEAGYGYFRGCTARNWRFLSSTMPYSKSDNACVFSHLNSSTAIQNQDVSRDQDTSHSYHSNLECIRFVTLALGHFAPSCSGEKIHSKLL